ncbi:MAG: electron transfer flavoprotein alpha subunit [Lysobacterales bacterium]|jgi:electron transfer flavoprotein alpha subunit
MTKILIIAEHNGESLNPSTSKCVSCATAIGGDVEVLVLGNNVSSVADEAADIQGVSTVHLLEADHLQAPLAVNWAAEIVAMSDGYSHIMGPSTTLGRDLMPRVAALLGVNQISDIMEVDDSHSFKRPIYAGNAIVNVSAPAGITVVATVRIASWSETESGGNANIETHAARCEAATHTSYIGLESGGADRPDLQTAKVVVSGGRAFGSAENFKLIYDLADKLGAGCGASRAAVDAGYVPNDMQVGQTGKIISPDLYMAFGISGAIQHVTGIKDAGTIVAINKDADAPIFELADIGLAGDLFTVIPEMMDLLD